VFTLQVMLLALASTVRPTSLAATYALLGTGEPRRYMTAYVISGLLFTVLFGTIVVVAVGGIDIRSGTTTTKAVAELAGGVLALVLGMLVLRGRLVRGGPAGDLPGHASRWDRLVEGRLTLRTAILAGPATHVPGIFYLLALNLIVAHRPGIAGALAEVLLYNAIWFALPLAALAVCVADPDAARSFVGAVNAWARAHRRAVALAALFGVGSMLVINGLVHLL
jgi:hypothetical protein